MTIQGIDISHWQKGLDLAETSSAFVMLKATEGTTVVDAECDQFYQVAKTERILRGVYHFYRGGGASEADYFVSNIRDYIGDAVLALDFEDDAHIGDQAGALAFLDRVHDLTGVKPLVYASGSVVTGQDWSAVVAGDYGLWLARWGSAPGSTGQWTTLAMWQKSNSGNVSGYTGRVDLDEFYGDATTWAAYARSAGTPAPAPAPTPTPAPVTLGSREIRLGSTGADVATWQGFLDRYYNIDLDQDGSFGPLTDKWTRVFQQRSGLVVDGIVGSKTLAKAGY